LFLTIFYEILGDPNTKLKEFRSEKSKNGRKFKNCDESIAARVQEWTKLKESLYDVKFECEDRIFLSRNSQIQAENAKINSESSELPDEFSNNSKDSKNSIQDEVMLRQKASNKTAVIVSVSIVSIAVL
jgi:hypothetical protein